MTFVMAIASVVWLRSENGELYDVFMFFGLEGNSISLEHASMDYVEFGRGEQPLVILPGLSDGFKTVKGQAIPILFYYKQLAKSFRVYVFSRKRTLAKNCSTREMAKDQNVALEQLGIEQPYVMGVSQGGMIDQHLAIDFPGSVKKLIIAVSLAKQNKTIQHVVNSWIQMAKADDYQSLVIDTLETERAIAL